MVELLIIYSSQVEKGKVRYVQDYSESAVGGTMTADSDAFYFRVTVEGHDGPIGDGSGGGEPHKFAIAIVTPRSHPVILSVRTYSNATT